jgi:hypothetical protein
LLGGALIALMLIEIFCAFLLPRRVKRDPRVVRSVFAYAWDLRAVRAELAQPVRAGGAGHRRR